MGREPGRLPGLFRHLKGTHGPFVPLKVPCPPHSRARTHSHSLAILKGKNGTRAFPFEEDEEVRGAFYVKQK